MDDPKQLKDLRRQIRENLDWVADECLTQIEYMIKRFRQTVIVPPAVSSAASSFISGDARPFDEIFREDLDDTAVDGQPLDIRKLSATYKDNVSRFRSKVQAELDW